MRRIALVAILSALVSTAFLSAYAHASSSLDIQRYEHRGCAIHGNEHYPPEYAQVGLRDTYWYSGDPKDVDFEYENCREVVRQVQDSCDFAVEYVGYLPPQDRQECEAQYRAEVPKCRAHYVRQYQVCETIKSSPNKEAKQTKGEEKEALWEELLPDDSPSPGWEELESDEPYDHTSLDRELDRQEQGMKRRDGRLSDLDEALERLAMRRHLTPEQDSEPMTPEEIDLEELMREVESSERMDEIEQELQRLLQQRNEIIERERVARLQRERDNAEGISTFLQMLGTGVQLYNMFDQVSNAYDSHYQDSAPGYSSSDDAEYQQYLQQLRNSSSGQGNCMPADTACSYNDPNCRRDLPVCPY